MKVYPNMWLHCHIYQQYIGSRDSTSKYLGYHMDTRFTLKEHITKKMKQIYLLIGKKSKLTLDNKTTQNYHNTNMDLWNKTLE